MSADIFNIIGDIVSWVVIWMLIYKVHTLEKKTTKLKKALRRDKNINSVAEQNQNNPDYQAASDGPE